MARWDDGYTLWDDGTIWDGEASPDDLNLLWGIRIDWGNTGTLNVPTNEWQKAIKVSYELGRVDYIRLSGDEDEREATGFYYVDPGSATIVLDNSDDRYSARNEDSPLYPNVQRGRLAQISVKTGIYGIEYKRFTGYVNDIDVDNEAETATISLIGPLIRLAKTDASLGLHKTIKISEAIGEILDYVEWPPALGRNIETTSDTLSYWWTRGRRALSELHDLADGDLGTLFCAGDGSLTFHTRNHAGATAVSLTEPEVGKNIKQRAPWDVICNLIETTVLPLVPQATGVLWELVGDLPYFEPGESREFFCPLQYNDQACPADNIISPVATTDYTANTSADGSGTDKTANFSVTRTDLGIMVKLTVKNNGGAGEGAYLRTLQVRGDAVIAPNPVTLIRTDDASIRKYGRLRFRYSSNWLQNLNLGDSLADLLVLLLTNELGFLMVEIDSLPDKQFAAGLFDSVQVDFIRMNVSEAMRVGYYRDEWISPNGQAVKTTLKLEPQLQMAGDYFRFDESLLDTDSNFAP
jgi:hypothetical protein